MIKRDLVAEKLMTIAFEEGNALVPHISLDKEVFEELCSPWRDVLVITLVGKSLSYNVFKDRLQRIWKLQEGFDMVDVDHGFYYVKFDLKANRDTIIGGGPWMLFDHYVAIACWTPEFVAPMAKVDCTMVWIRFPSPNMVYYDENFLLSLASCVGRPIKVDTNTLMAACGRYARGGVYPLAGACLFDLGAIGSRFTWFRREQGGRNVSKRLDRALADTDWWMVFSEAYVDIQITILFLSVVVLMVSLSRVILSAFKLLGRLMLILRRRKRRLEARNSEIQLSLETCDSHALVTLEAQLRRDYNKSLREEEMLWYQKSREQWTIVRRKRNKIHGLFLGDGSWTSDPIKLRVEANSYFQSIFCGLSSSNLDICNVLTLTLSATRVDQLTAPVTFDEVYRQIMSMHSFKSPGIDGFQPYFFKKYWPIVGKNIWKIVQDAFHNGFANPRLLETLVVLIPKVASPTSLKDLCPISLCNVAYKMVTKVLKKGVLAFKVNLEKAYDRVSWDFLKQTVVDFGIPASIVKMVMWCVRNGSMSLLWNGSRLDSFSPTRGLRQGDLMSPYFFVLSMVKLSLLIQQKVDLGLWQPIKLSQSGSLISHLLFDDDVLLFCKATNTQVILLSSTLDDFCQASGNYLGVPSVQGRVRRAIFNPLIEKIQRRMNSWKSNLLNQAGKLCLAKSVSTVVPIYTMQSMWLPHNVCNEMDKMTRNFIWDGDPNKRSLNLVNWEVITRNKKDGGLGIRDTRTTNVSLLGKLTWDLIQGSNKLWCKVLTEKYTSDGCLLFAANTCSSSPV
ncbi:PREDICTED: uncharacterized protein LOC109329367 [Lupinus angustifolius]|uniref:uncharacterized protein LOC109329367 n=1 Tax=Lupinus angustifolius TaxID=3871 RepID=UPI00092E7D82|nr:PREDICTED: uncharacterized protein LOC109329367 [Lupinus angustifolius]